MSSAFSEQQYFRNPVTYAVLVVLGLVVIVLGYGTLKQLVWQQPFGSKPAPDVVLIGLTAFTLALLFAIIFMRLDTKADRDGISYRWWPWQANHRLIQWHEIKHLTLVQHGFIGYGIRITKLGLIHNAGGRYAVLVQLKNGKRIGLGTQRPEDFLAALNRFGANVQPTGMKPK